jgi:hypothetical protein
MLDGIESLQTIAATATRAFARLTQTEAFEVMRLLFLD